MNKVIHHNYWYWGESHIIVIDNGNGIVNMQIDNDNPKRGYISGLSVVNNVRNNGLGNILLCECEKLAIELELSEVCLYAEKDSFTFDWYKRHGYIKDRYRNKNLYRLIKQL